jgi:hypothetical protein
MSGDEGSTLVIVGLCRVTNACRSMGAAVEAAPISARHTDKRPE